MREYKQRALKSLLSDESERIQKDTALPFIIYEIFFLNAVNVAMRKSDKRYNVFHAWLQILKTVNVLCCHNIQFHRKAYNVKMKMSQQNPSCGYKRKFTVLIQIVIHN